MNKDVFANPVYANFMKKHGELGLHLVAIISSNEKHIKECTEEIESGSRLMKDWYRGRVSEMQSINSNLEQAIKADLGLNQ